MSREAGGGAWQEKRRGAGEGGQGVDGDLEGVRGYADPKYSTAHDSAQDVKRLRCTVSDSKLAAYVNLPDLLLCRLSA